MCTAIAWNNGDFYFGRNMDIEYSFGEKLVLVPRNYNIRFKKAEQIKNHYAMMGIACVMDNYPLFAEAVNEKGLCMAGLNFPDFAVYNKEVLNKDNITPYEFIPWVLAKCKNTKEAEKLLENINLFAKEFKPEIPLASLHWIIADKEKSVVVESTENGFKVYNNPTGVITNNPSFDFHLTNLRQYLALNSRQPSNNMTKEIDLKAFSQGFGALGLPGDFSSASRFIKAYFVKANSVCIENESSCVSQVFHMLESVAFVKGSVITSTGDNDITSYSCCVNASKQIYYYKTYENSQITALNMNTQNLDSEKLLVFLLEKEQKINYIK